MYLKHLTLTGFKSFAKKSELEFTTPITAIVGPNGSGKSNVAEAFRFVLGEQSMKSMRGKKGEDLIWGGSESVARANRASVAVTLDNEKKVFPIDFDEITIERVVHRDGTNEYLLNGSRARLKDVQELLAAANIGPSGHHIISQGEADRILSAAPKDRREMIEDALGLKVYQFKRQEAERKLGKTTENIAHVESLRREVQPHLKFLERQVKKIEKSRELQEQLKAFYLEYLRREDVYIAEHTDRLTAKKREPETKLENLKEELTKARETLEASGEDEKSGALVELEGKISTVRQKRQEVVRESGQVEGQIEFLRRRIEDLQKEGETNAQVPIPHKDVAGIVSTIESKIEDAAGTDDVGTLRKLLDDIRETLTSFVKSATGASAARETKAEEEELVRLEKEKHAHDESLAAISKEEEALQKEYETLRESIESERSESRAAEREVFRLMNDIRETEHTLQKIEEELTTLERDRNEFKRELQEAVALIGSAASQYFRYEITADGAAVSKEDIVSEDRERQRERRRELEKMKIRLEELGAGATEDVMKEYKDVKERDEFLEREIADLNASVEKLESLIAELTDELNKQFVAGIEKIDGEFGRFFTLMFGGGEAHLKRVKPKVKKKKDEDESLGDEEGVPSEASESEASEAEEGIEIDVKLPNKRVKGLDMLSGGERALTSIALIFAMSQVNPPLFLVLDETDAALDEANSRRYGDLIESLAKRSQLILITHNRETMSRAGVLYGVTMAGDGVSKLLSVKFDEAVQVAK